MLVIGVNGVGKTTTIGKLAHQLTRPGQKGAPVRGRHLPRRRGRPARRSGRSAPAATSSASSEGADPAAVVL
ncbi:MAG: hypothetical protein ACLT1A_15295 [Dysosmobacter sp.]